jgi:predicted nucleotidyltransferase component of viral defense system
LYKYDKSYFEHRSTKTGFIRDSLEKVYRLVDVLEYVNRNPLLQECLALKGGTAINLAVFNLPRLSVDIDFDFCLTMSRDEMLQYRKRINNDILTYLLSQGYTLNSGKGKNSHSLDSWVFWYINAAGNRDNIKIEINYSMRDHILPPEKIPIQTDLLEKSFAIKTLAPLELFGSKIKALIDRTAARDLFDINNVVYFGTFDESEQALLKKCILFYLAIGGNQKLSEEVDLSTIDNLSWYKIQQSLLPMLRKSEWFDLEVAKKRVKSYLTGLLQLNPSEKAFLISFQNKEYKPELLFDDCVIIDRIKNHPMALWRISAKDKI